MKCLKWTPYVRLLSGPSNNNEPTKSAPVTVTTEVPTRDYGEELAILTAIAKKAKKLYHIAKVEADQLRAQAAELHQLLDAQTAQLQETEKNVVASLKAANDFAMAKLAEVEEEHQRAARQKSERNRNSAERTLGTPSSLNSTPSHVRRNREAALLESLH